MPAFVITNLGYGHSDNATRETEPNALESGFRIIGVEFGAEHEGARFSADVTGDLELRQYVEENVLAGDDDDEVLGTADTSFQFAVVPERFDWDVSAGLDQTRSDAFAAIGPNNRETIRVVSTGPSINLPLGGRSAFRMSAVQSDRELDNSDDLDGRTTTVQLGFFRSLSQVSQAGVQFANAETDFDLDAQDDYEFDTVYVSYERRFASGGVRARLGKGEVAIGSDTDDTGLFDFTWQRDLATRSQLTVLASNELTDATSRFLLDDPAANFGSIGDFSTPPDLYDIRIGDVVLSSNPLERSNVEAQFMVEGERVLFAVSAGAFRERYEDDGAVTDSDGAVMRLDVRVELGRRWTTDIGFRGLDRDFINIDQEDLELSTRLTARRSFGRRADVELAVERNRRESDAPDSFDENLYMLLFTYAVLQ